ncbi:DUF2388 domain-containing protein [Halopseudomonas pelagia]|uniref:DUF2388 domain-containing protein n=1 Tax=Halopseudomonas pelagia TaxID=553151 RepID=UPI0003A0BD7F|nr:DUF2388 domain-containing protein [Halopseudomonas pelagia]|tara:strand:+ start:1200 stop:1520 length:321 start_codon:yes stop_codon:yes gene_type:complete
MKIRSVFLVAGLLGFSAVASASSFVGTTNALGSSLANTAQALGDSTASTFGSDKVVLQAREDAASFVGSNGDVRGVNLEAALSHIRQQMPALQASDMQLAEAILAL